MTKASATRVIRQLEAWSVVYDLNFISGGGVHGEGYSPKKLSEWAKEIKKARQLELNESFIATKLKSFANAKRDFEPMRSQNKGLKNEEYKCMFVGVWITDYSLYRNVTDKFHLMLNQAVKTTKEEMSLLATTSLSINLAVLGASVKSQTLIWAQIIKYFFAGIKWINRVKPHGEWDYKDKMDNPFGKAASNISEYSSFFYYAGYQGKSYNHGRNMKGILRFDDPGNLAYAATGAEIAVFISGGSLEKLLIKGLAEAFAAGKGDNILIKGPDGIAKSFKEGGFDPENLDVALFDDAHDIAVINWGYDAYAQNFLQTVMSHRGFRKVLKLLTQR